MQFQPIFCPKCNTLILAKSTCPHCKWERPSAAPLSGEGKPLWAYNAQARLHSAPVVDGNMAFFGAENGDLIAVDLDARRAVWTLTLNSGQTSESVAIWSDSVIYGEMTSREIGTLDKDLVAVDVHTGEERWRFDTASMSVSSPAVASGTVYAVSSSKILHAVDASSGKELWQAPIKSAWSPAAPLVTSSIIYVPVRGNELQAIDANNGQECWTCSASGWMPKTPVVLDDILYVSSWDGHLYAFEARTGKKVWDFQTDKFLISSPGVGREFVYVGCHDKNLYIVDRATGKLRQRLKAGRVNGAPLIMEGILFFGSDDHHLYAYNARTLALLWSFDAGSSLKTALACRGDSLLAATHDGHVFEIQWRRKAEEIAPETLEARGDLEHAAMAYALRGNLSQAAKLYENLKRFAEAAALYAEAHEFEPAAVNYEHAGKIDSALAIWRQLDRPERTAALLENAKRYAEAAPIYELIAQQKQAAGIMDAAKQLYAQAGQMFEAARQSVKAYDMYELAGDLDKAFRLAGQSGDDRKKAQVLEKQGNYRQAADLLRSREPIKAAELYNRAGGPENKALAIALYKAQGSRELLLKARTIAEESGAWLEYADISQRLGEPLAAGRAYERAAGDLEVKPEAERDSAAIATLYDRAAAAYREAVESERRKECERKARQLRQHPEISVGINPNSDIYRKGESNTITVLVRNIGFGPAFQITLTIGGQFEAGALCPPIEALRQDGSEVVQIYIRPRDSGERVRLDVTVEYQSRQKNRFKETQSVGIPVQPARGEERIIVQGDYVEGTKTGDVGYFSYGRKTGRGEGEVCPKCNQPVKREYQFCPNCQASLQPAKRPGDGSS